MERSLDDKTKELQNCMKNHETEIQNLSKNYEGQIKVVKEEQNKEVSKLREKHSEEMLILNQEHSEEITKLKASLNELVHVESPTDKSGVEELQSSLDKAKAETKEYLEKINNQEEEIKKSSEVIIFICLFQLSFRNDSSMSVICLKEIGKFIFNSFNVKSVWNVQLFYHPSLPLYLPADSISKTRIKVYVN